MANKRRPKRRPKEVEVNIDRKDVNRADLYESKDNDASWYDRNNQLTFDAGNLPTTYPIGYQFPITVYPEYSRNNNHYAIPGICNFDYVPAVGVSDDAQSPINVASRNLYSFVRFTNSGSVVGDPSDLMFYFLAGDSLVMWHQLLCRAYGCMRRTDYENLYIPRALVNAMHFDYDDLNTNLAQFRYHINTLALRLNSLAIPNDMAYVTRHAWLTSGVYKDGESNKSQMYMFTPTYFWQYTETTTPNSLKAVRPNRENNLIRLVDIMNFTDKLLNAVLQSESFGVTTGNVVKAYGRDYLLRIAEISEDYTVIPEYSQEVLSQIENLDIVRAYVQGIDLTQDTTVAGDNWILSLNSNKTGNWNISAEVENGYSALMEMANLTGAKFINFHKDMVTPSDIMVASRLTSRLSDVEYTLSTNNLGIQVTPEAIGSEVVVGGQITTMLQNATNPYVVDLYLGNGTTGTNADPGVLNPQALNGLCAIQQFDWHPETVFATKVALTQHTTMSKFILDSSDQNSVVLNDTRDIDNFTIANVNTVSRLHEVALLSLFASPRIATATAQPYRRVQ